MKLVFIFLFCGFAFMAGGCATNVSAIHDPLYNATAHTSTITATARNTDSGISHITIHLIKGDMTNCSELGGGAQVTPCRTNAVSSSHICIYPGGVTNATCTYSFTMGNQSIVSYTATAKPVNGSSRSTQEITYSGGYPPTAGILRPIWWHRDKPEASKIDLGFYPDSDYSGDYNSFTQDTQRIIKGSFFNSGQEFAKTYTLYRENFNLWAAPFGANAEGCSRTFNALVSPLAAVTDGEAIVHDDEFRDCASISQGGAGSVWANAGDEDWVFVHESGHFLHGQGDEYCCDGGYAFSGTCGNVFANKSACETAAPGHGASASNCVQIGSTGKWRNDTGSLETMEDRTDSSNWQTDSNYCVVNRFTQCGGGNCY